MEAFLNYQAGTLGLIGSPDDIRIVLTSIFDAPDVLAKLEQIIVTQEKQMAFGQDTIALIKKLSDATDAAAIRIQQKLDAALAKADVSDEDKAAISAALSAELTHLNSLAADPENPVPAPPADPEPTV